MYRTNTKPDVERSELIKRAVDASTEKLTFYEYQNQKTDLPKIRLDITVPVYRMQNYRTRTAQLKFIHEQGKAQDFFSTGQENESAQQAQHDILVTFAKDGRSGSISPIYDELQSEEQREPLLITSGGVIVNGNRRLAAMRELLTERASDFKHFSHVDCAVLPGGVTPDEIREIEVRLQMRPETKLPYGWINESIAIQELLDSGKNLDYVSDLMKKKEKDVKRAARALLEAEIYLKDWLREPGEYQHVEDAEQFFNDLAKAVSGKEGQPLEASRRIAWALLSNPQKLSRRVYDYNFSFDKRTDEVVSSLVDRLGIDLSVTEPQGDDEADPLDIDLEDEEEATSLDPLIEVFDDNTQRDHVADQLISICDTILELDRQGEIGRRALAAVQAANNKLQEVDLSKADPTTYGSIDSQLDSVIDRATKLKASLGGYIGPDSES